jgi:hypothetical protein
VTSPASPALGSRCLMGGAVELRSNRTRINTASAGSSRINSMPSTMFCLCRYARGRVRVEERHKADKYGHPTDLRLLP